MHTRGPQFMVIGLLLAVLLVSCAAPEPLLQISPFEPLVEEAPAVSEAPGVERSGRSDTKQGETSVRLGFGFKPTSDGTSAAKLARDAEFIVLTKNDEEFLGQLRAAEYSRPVLQYVLANEVDGPRNDPCDPDFKPWQNQIPSGQGEFCDVLDANEDWFLHNGAGERLYGTYRDRVYWRMNPASPGWRAFVLKRLKQYLYGDESTPPLGYNGIFFDNIELKIDKSRHKLPNSDGEVREYGSEAEFYEAWRGYLQYMRDGLGPDVPLWANMVEGDNGPDEWDIYLPYLDGIMNEAFATGYQKISRQNQTNHLIQAETAIRQGKGLYMVSRGEEDDTERQEFSLASFLLIAEPDAPLYFRYSLAANGAYAEWWLYDNYNVELGKPLGPRYAVRNGWRRDFEGGYVVVDQKNRSGKIVELAAEKSE